MKPTEYPGVYVEEVTTGVTPIEGVSTSTTAFIGRAERGPDTAVHCHTLDDYIDAFGGEHSGSQLTRHVREFFANGGKSCHVVRASADANGLHALDAIPTLNLLVIPRDDGIDDASFCELAGLASRYCVERRALLLLDAPRDFTHANEGARIAQLHASTAPENVAVFYPDVFLLADGAVSTGAAGAIAAMMARMDETRGVWKAAAGADAWLAGDPKPTVELNATASQNVVDAGVNPIRSLNGHTIVWGARTLAARNGASEWKYIPVRRLVLFLEQSIEQGLKWAVLEPNSEPLWSRSRSAVEHFLNGLWRNGAFAGSKPEQAYFVRCGRDTMTQDDVDNGRIIVEVGVAPLRPAEFIMVRIQLR